MPRTVVPKTGTGVAAGVPLSTVAIDAANDHELANDGSTIIAITNSSGTNTITVDIPTSVTVKGRAVGDDQGIVAISSTKYFGPFDPNMYNQSAGLVHIDISGTSPTGTIGALSVAS